MIEAIETSRDTLAELCRRFHVERLDVFGSAATGELDESSDLDFLVAFDRIDSMRLADQYFGLLEALEDLFGRDVDLLTERSLRNPYFVASVQKTRQQLYAA